MKELGLDDSGEEINIGLFDSNGRKYRMDPEDEFDEDVLRDFLKAWRKGEWMVEMGRVIGGDAFGA